MSLFISQCCYVKLSFQIFTNPINCDELYNDVWMCTVKCVCAIVCVGQMGH